MRTIETDYLVVGAGAMGMAFADTLVAESDARVVIVDRGSSPGGHWTRAYPFVRLHQPSAYYGVNSRPLGSGAVDDAGWNAGLHELATGDEVCGYFDEVMEKVLLPTGRVSYLPDSEYLGDDRIVGHDGDEVTVDVRRRTVDATYLQTVVPSMRPPAYGVADGVTCVPPNELPALAEGFDHFTVVGAGKTGIDACLWLLAAGVAPERLRWIMPRDAWLLDRENIQPGADFLDRFKTSFGARLKSITDADSVDDLFAQLEANGNLLRLDPAVRPTMYRCATVSRAELDQLRRIDDVIRLGRVERIEPSAIVLTGGEVPSAGSALYVDCTADGLEKRPAVDVFDGDRLVLQSVRGCQQVFSAGLIAHLELSGADDAANNALCRPVPHPDADVDWLAMTLAEHHNELRWLAEPELMDWLATSRLNLLREMLTPMLARPRSRERLLGMIAKALQAANDKLELLLREG
ncbi:NAD(P)-binding protein [Mycobacterium sp. NPDC050551]|uniref:NAD(P)-binding protein n=1 Tax=Mycobacterium sp. NPDC050551 TaxID=3155407 RepID=UPI00341BB236